jgi:hypothetical protein
MTPKDYIPLSAVLIALISLAISILSWRFTARAKGSELRALLLSSLHTTLVKAENLLSDYTLCKSSALDAKQIDLFKSFTKEDKLKSIIEEVQTTLGEVERANGRTAIKLYDRVVARTSHLSARVDDVWKEMSAIKTSILQEIRRASEAERKV